MDELIGEVEAFLVALNLQQNPVKHYSATEQSVNELAAALIEAQERREEP